ncbi:MAG: hypothetical protein WC119_10180 [Synergistaceae bacterium]
MSYVQVADDDILDDIVGIYKDWTETSAAWHYCDCDGDPITLPVGWQNRHPILPNLKTCLVDTLGVPTFGSNPRGDGLTLTDKTKQVMVRVPAVYGDRWWEGDTEFFVPSRSPVTTPGGRSLTLHPAFYQRGGWPRSELFVGRYYCGLAVSAAGTKYAVSASGKQPWTGGEMVELAFTDGRVEPAVNDYLTGLTSGVRGQVVDWYVSSGAWVDSDAAGKIYLKLVDERVNFNNGSGAFAPGQTATGESSGATCVVIAVVKTSGDWGTGNAAGYLVVRGGNGKTFTTAPSENITDPLGGAAKATGDGSIKAPFTGTEDLQVLGSTTMKAGDAGTSLSLNCSEMDGYCRAYGGTDPRWGLIDPYTNDLLSMLAYLDLGTCDVQALTSVGAGVTSKPATRMFGGVNNGADSIDTAVDIYGTGKGTGTAGQTPCMWRGIQDFWGNVYGFVIGIQPNKNGVWDIIHPNGLSIPASPLAAGSFVSTITPCHMTSGYWGASIKEAAAKWLLLPADATGSNVQKRCDYYYAPNYNPGVLLVGGRWGSGSNAGVAYRYAYDAASTSDRYVGGRLEFIP